MALIEVVPQSATYKDLPVTLLYIQELPMGTMMAWFFDSEGEMQSAKLEEIRVDFRFDGKLQKWRSVAPGAVEDERDTTTFG